MPDEYPDHLTQYFSDEQIRKWEDMQAKRWIRVDPETKKPHANSKEFFWEIVHMVPGAMAGKDSNHPPMNFVVQRFYRNKTYQVNIPDGKGGAAGQSRRHVAWNDSDKRGHLRSPGDMMIEADAFAKQFVEDK